MPKVKEEYFEKKRDVILCSAIAVLRRKPLYELTMTDVIKKAGLSKGGIYLYYKNMDELLIAVLNKIAEENLSPVNIDKKSLLGKNAEEQIFYIFEKLAEYITSRNLEYGKALFELQMLATKNAAQVARILPNLTMKQEGTVYMELLYPIIDNALQGKNAAGITTASVLKYIGTSIDGITTSLVMYQCYSFENFKIDVSQQLKVLAYSVAKICTC